MPRSELLRVCMYHVVHRTHCLETPEPVSPMLAHALADASDTCEWAVDCWKRLSDPCLPFGMNERAGSSASHLDSIGSLKAKLIKPDCQKCKVEPHMKSS